MFAPPLWASQNWSNPNWSTWATSCSTQKGHIIREQRGVRRGNKVTHNVCVLDLWDGTRGRINESNHHVQRNLLWNAHKGGKGELHKGSGNHMLPVSVKSKKKKKKSMKNTNWLQVWSSQSSHVTLQWEMKWTVFFQRFKHLYGTRWLFTLAGHSPIHTHINAPMGGCSHEGATSPTGSH